MNNKYILINGLRLLIKIALVLCLFFCIFAVYKSYYSVENYYYGMPQIMAFGWLFLYVLVLGFGVWGLILTKRKMKEYFPERYTSSDPMIKKIIKVILMIVVEILIGVLILLVIFPFIGLHFAINRHVLYSDNTFLQRIFIAEDYGIKDNVLTITTEDGYNLWVAEIPVEKPLCVIINLSGIDQPSVTQFYPQAKYMQEKGYASFLLEVRGHGRSSGDKICLGYDEVNDIAAVVRYIKENENYKDVPIVIQGVSMGGSIATNSFGQIEDIDALIAMSTYSSVEEVVCDIMKQYKVPKLLIQFEKPIIKAALKKSFGSDKVEHMNPYTQIKNANGRPVLLIGSIGDTSVPIENLYRLKEACPQAEVWVKDSWEHFIINECDFNAVESDTEYCNRIIGFIEKVVESANES